MNDDPIAALADFVDAHPCLFVLTGAGVSTGSGIPGYRDRAGQWQRKQPVTHQEFVGSEAVRQRYWARSMIGFALMDGALPNAAHRALAQLEQSGRIAQLVTQNVDGLHQRAGSRRVTELHGSIHRVVCMGCGAAETRAAVQARLVAANPAFLGLLAATAPDGDADLEGADFGAFRSPPCMACGGLLKPDVVFYGASVPRVRADAAMAALLQSDAVLVAGSSLMVYSGYRFCQRAHAVGKPVAAINFGHTRADALLQIKLESDCGAMLGALAERFAAAAKGRSTDAAHPSHSTIEPATAQ